MSELKKGINSKFQPFLEKLRVLVKNKNFAYGVPFFIFVIGGSFGLREWTTIRYEFSKNKSLSAAEVEKLGLKRERKVTLEDVFEEIKTLDIDNWENKRGPRPWEETPQK